jgi:hypothetical protein
LTSSSNISPSRVSRLELGRVQVYKRVQDTKRTDASRAKTMSNPAPVVGKWYARPGGDSFEIVAIDGDDGTIEIQYFDGTIEELDFDEWREDEIVSASPPEDWTGSVDVEPEDTENEFDAVPGVNGSSPFEAIDRGEADGFSELEMPDEPQERP